jgi:hypothetical protein
MMALFLRPVVASGRRNLDVTIINLLHPCFVIVAIQLESKVPL